MTPARPRLFLLAAVALLTVANLWLALFWQPVPPAHERPLPPPHAGPAVAAAAPAAGGHPDALPGGDVAFITAAGPRRLSDDRGKLIVLYFGYTFCPDICPTALLDLAAALNSLSPAEQAHVQPLFVSLDPARDTPEHLAAYVRFFHPALVGGTPAPADLPDAAARYGVRFVSHARPGASAYAVDHSSHFSLIDPAGRLAQQLPHGTPPAAIAAAIRTRIPTH